MKECCLLQNPFEYQKSKFKFIKLIVGERKKTITCQMYPWFCLFISNTENCNCNSKGWGKRLVWLSMYKLINEIEFNVT